ncbi:MAG: hypothetical protein RJA70_3771 [Pseudomonadota bacterium]
MFKKVLVANRGEIALRILQTCRRLGIATVAVYSEADRHALHVQSADESVYLGGSRAQDSYLSIEALANAILSSGADAVHPGYGLLSEDARFSAQVRALGATFIGPSDAALAQFGDKLRARAFAATLGIESPPGTPAPVNAADESAIEQAASQIGYPLLVKAAAGGGGIGMQQVSAAADLKQAVTTCTARSAAAFGDSRVYLERYFAAPRHIEVQVIADAFGNVVSLGERECSVQRRHQKILEESPSPAAAFTGTAGAALRAALHTQAAQLLRAAGYQGLGTVEFLADFSGETPSLYFLEVNARIQVEHPVTERLYGLDLVEAQLAVAAGQQLGAHVLTAEPSGHSIEVRLYAEDPHKSFFPQPGKLELLAWPEGVSFGAGTGARTPLRVDTGYATGDEITSYYDPLIAKIISWGDSRATAIRLLADGLERSQVSLMGPKGPRHTNLEFLRALLRDQRFVQGEYDTRIVGQLQP